MSNSIFSIFSVAPFKHETFWTNKYNHLKPHFYEKREIFIIASKTFMGLGVAGTVIGAFYVSPVAISAGLLTGLFGIALNLKKEFPKDPAYSIELSKKSLLLFVHFPSQLTWEKLKRQFNPDEITTALIHLASVQKDFEAFLINWASKIDSEFPVDLSSLKYNCINFISTCLDLQLHAPLMLKLQKIFKMTDEEFGDALAKQKDMSYEQYVELFDNKFLKESTELVAYVKNCYLDYLKVQVTGSSTTWTSKEYFDKNAQLHVSLDEFIPLLKNLPITKLLKIIADFNTEELKTYFENNPEWEKKFNDEFLLKSPTSSSQDLISEYSINNDPNYLLKIGLISPNNPILLNHFKNQLEKLMDQSVKFCNRLPNQPEFMSQFYAPFAPVVDDINHEIKALQSKKDLVNSNKKAMEKYQEHMTSERRKTYEKNTHADLKSLEHEMIEFKMKVPTSAISSLIKLCEQKDTQSLEKKIIQILHNFSFINYYGANNSVFLTFRLILNSLNNTNINWSEIKSNLKFINSSILSKQNLILSRLNLVTKKNDQAFQAEHKNAISGEIKFIALKKNYQHSLSELKAAKAKILSDCKQKLNDALNKALKS